MQGAVPPWKVQRSKCLPSLDGTTCQCKAELVLGRVRFLRGGWSEALRLPVHEVNILPQTLPDPERTPLRSFLFCRTWKSTITWTQMSRNRMPRLLRRFCGYRSKSSAAVAEELPRVKHVALPSSQCTDVGTQYQTCGGTC
ncbi:hypothetical protein E2C01_035160 [Portunus trituberculatus]|uniref:Uncharacterized protein n=1 Tax=Portunus trituberculatus TaxID=210409 RepID=A0A5B7F3G6_PORTR|nr:hypothetical protein [Portunus trituberculatus]